MVTTNTPPRRRSFFGPLLLIGIGTLWLLGTFGVISVGNLWVLLRLWPLLLIAAGLDLLFGRLHPLISALISLVTVGLAVAAVLFAPQLGLAPGGWTGAFPMFLGGTRGSGHIITESRAVSGFDGVAFSSFGNVEIVQGDAEALTIETDDDVLPQLRTEVRGNTLYIGETQPENWFRRVQPTHGITYRLTVKTLSRLDVSGAGEVHVAGLTTDNLDVSLSGAGSLKLDGLEAKAATFRLSGAGSLQAAGQAPRQDVRLSGFGEYRGGDLESQTADVAISGAGSVTVWVTQSLTAQIGGAGSVRYYGSPTVSKSITGAGSVEGLGSK